MAAMKRIEFNVDYGLNFNSKNVEKEIAKQLKEKEQFVKEYYEKNKKMPPIKMNIDNAVDIEGNPVDKKSLDAVVKKYEKAMNAALKTMTEDFRKNLGKDIAGTLSESFSTEFENLFNNIENLIVDKFKDMYTNISSVISGINPVVINADDMIQVKDSKDKALSQSAENFKKEATESAKQIENSSNEYKDNVTESVEKIEETNKLVENVTSTKRRKTSKKDQDDSVLEALEKITKKRGKTLDRLENEAVELILKAEEIRDQIKNIDETIETVEKEKAELNDSKKKIEENNSLNVKIGKTTYTDDSVSEIKKDAAKTKKVLTNLYTAYQETFTGIEELEDQFDEDLTLPKEVEKKLDALRNKSSNISQVIKSIVDDKKQLMKMLSLTSDDDEYIVENIFGEEFIGIDVGSNDGFIEKSLKDIEGKIASRENEIKSLRNSRKELTKQAEGIQKEFLEIEKVPKYQNSHMQAGDLQIAGENGKLQAYGGMTIYPTVNVKSFIKQVQRVVKACDEALQSRPVEVPIMPKMETVGSFKQDIENVLLENPIKLAIDKVDIAQQIQDSIKGVKVDINGNLTGLNIGNNPTIISNNTETVGDNPEIISSEDLSGWEELESGLENGANEINDVVADILNIYAEMDKNAEAVESNLENIVKQTEDFSKIANQVLQKVTMDDANISTAHGDDDDDYGEEYYASLFSQAENEAEELEGTTEQVGENLENATQEAKKLKETIGQTVDALIGEVKKIDDPRIQISKDKIEAYKYLENFKPAIVKKSKEEKELIEKGDARTAKENDRLRQLEWGRKQQRKRIEAERQPIRDDWAQIDQYVDRINILLLRGLDELERYEKHGKLTGKKLSRLQELGNPEEFTKEDKLELEKLKKQKNLTSNAKERLKVLEKKKEDYEEFKDLKKQNELTDAEQERLRILREQKKWNAENAEEYQRQLAAAEKELEVQKKKSVYFGKMHNTALVEFSNEKKSKKNATVLTNQAIEDIATAQINNSAISQRYQNYYKQSVDAVKKDKNGSNLLEEQLKRLVKIEEVWNQVNNDISEKGKEEALKEVNDQVAQLESRLSEISTYETQIKQNYEKGIYTQQKYDEEIDAISKEKSIIRAQKKNAVRKRNIIAKYEAEEIDAIAKSTHEKRVLYEEDLKTQVGIDKRINELRHRDIKSYKQYLYQRGERKQRVDKNRIYEDRIKRRKQDLIRSGMSEQKADKLSQDVVKGTDYKSNKRKMNELGAQVQNIEADLKETISLLEQIEELQNKIKSSDTPPEAINSIEQTLSNKRNALETLLGRVGWQSEDIKTYRTQVQEDQNRKQKIYNLDRTRFDVKDFEKDTKSTQEVVDKIQKALDEKREINNQLQDSIKNAKEHLEISRNKIETNINNAIQKLQFLKDEKARLQKEIEESNNAEEITKKQFQIGEIDSQLKKMQKIEVVSKDPKKLEAYITMTTEQINQQLLEAMDGQQEQILLYEKYIEDAEQGLKEQIAKRQTQEPTKKELKSRNINLGKQKKNINKEYNESIEKTQSQIEDIEAEIKDLTPVAEASVQAIDEEIAKLNEELETAEKNLENVKNAASISSSNKALNQTSTISDLYKEYNEKLKPYNKEYTDSKNAINDATSELKTVNTELDKLTEKYQDRIKRQEKTVRLIEQEIEAEKEKIKVKETEGKKVTKTDLNKIQVLEKRLRKETEVADQLRSQFSIESEMERKSKLAEMVGIAGRMQSPAMQKLISTGHKDATKDYNKLLGDLNRLAKETGVSFGKVETRILETGEAIKIVKFNLDEANQELKFYDTNDQEKYDELVFNKKKNENILSSTSLPDPQIRKDIQDEYANKIFEEAKKELKGYNDELAKNGNVTEEAKEHLLNLQRYMIEYGKVAGVKRDELNNAFGISPELAKDMSNTWKDAQNEISGSVDKINKKQIEVLEAEKEVERLRNSIDVKKRSREKTKAQLELRDKENELKQKQDELQRLKDEQVRANERISLEQEQNRNKLKEMSKAAQETNIKDIVPEDAAEAQEPIQEELKQTEEQAIKTSEALSKVQEESSSDNLKQDIIDEQSYSDKDITLETDAIEDKTRAQERLNEAEKENLAIVLEASKQQYVDTNTVSTDNKEALKEMGVLTDENRESVNKLFLEFAQGLSTIEQVVDKMLQLRDIADNINVSNMPNGQVNVQNLDNLVAELSSYIKSNKVADIKANPDELLGKYDAYINAGGTQEGFAQISKSKSSLVSFVQNLRNVETQAHETANAVVEIAQAEENITSTATAPSTVELQQEDAQEAIAKTDQMLQHQIAQAIQAAQISIAEGASVNIAGSVKIDEGQFGSLSEEFTDIQDVAYKLLEVVQDIYTVIEKNTNGVVQNIQSVQAPLSDVTAEAKEAGEAIEDTQIKLSRFGDNLKVVSGGDIDLGSEKFEAVKKAVEAMEQAISNNDMLKEIKDSGDITAKYISGTDKDGNTQAYVKLTSVFKDTKGEIVKLNHVYDVNAGKMEESSSISAKMANKFELQEKAAKKADAQLTYYTSKLDKLKVKYQMFNIDDFGIDDEGNLFAKAGTKAEEISDIITGKTKELIKNVILEMNKVDDKLNELKQQSKDGVLSTEQFDKLTSEYNLSIERFENSMNAVNRRINTQLEHTSRAWINSWQGDLAGVEAYVNNIDTTGLNKQGLQYVEQLKEALSDLNVEYVELHTQGEYFTQDQINSWKSQMQLINELKKKINSNSAKSYVNGKGFSLDGYSISEDQFKMMTQDSSYARSVLSALAQQIAKTDIEVVKLSEDNKTLTYTYKDQNKNIQTCKLSVSDLGRTIRNTNANSQKHVSLLSKVFGTLGDKLLQIMKYVSAYEIFYKVVNAIRNGVEIVKELDSAMTEMKKVTHESEGALKSFAKSSHKIAQEIGSTASIIQNSAADWMRLGYSIEEAAGLSKNTSILMNVSEFEDISSATEAMVAMIQAFKSEGKDVITLSEELIDKLNNIGNNYSISTSELAESLQRSSGTLIAANNSVDEAIALTTAGNAIIQDAETTGNALKVISMRIRGTSAKALEEEGEDTEGLIETTSKLEEKVKSLTAVNGKMGVSLLDANGNYRSTYAILQDIADVWEEIGKADIADGQNRQAALLETLAGKTRAQSLASILQNADMLRDAYEDVQNSEGSAARENEAYMESIEAHLQVLTAKWQELWDNALNSETINFVIDRLADLVDLIDKVGLGVSSIVAGGSIFGLYKFLNKNNSSGGRAKLS